MGGDRVVLKARIKTGDRALLQTSKGKKVGGLRIISNPIGPLGLYWN